MDQSGGSTGEPVRIFTGPEERGWRESGSISFFSHIGVPPGSRRAFMWGHHLDPVASDKAADRFKDFVNNRRWFDCLRLSEERLADYHHEMTRFQPFCVVAYASALASLAEFLERSGITPTYPTRCFVTGAEKLHDHQRDVIERVFERPVFERYGSRDVGDMAYQLSPGTPDLSVDWALTLVEPASADSDASIIVTKLHADAMPLIRYDTGDAATFMPGASPGHPVFDLPEVVGRSVDRIMLPDGRWVHGCHFPHLLKDFRIRDYQVHQSSDYSVDVRVNPAAEWSADDLAEIRRNLEANLPGISVSIKTVDDIPKSRAAKWRPVTSELGHRKADSD
jgi:phenylacetate-CoA ligase